MKTAGLIFLLSAVVSAAAQTNQPVSCCRHPLRVFGDHTAVNLTPLFRWWTHHETSGRPADGRISLTETLGSPARPLSAWRRITGTKAADLGYDWLVDAVIYTSPAAGTNARIILKNPPVVEEQAFYNLKNQIAAAGQQITNDQRAYQTHTKAAQKADARAGADSRSRSWKARLNADDYRQLAAQERAAAIAALNDQKQMEQARTLAQQQVNAIPAKQGRYQIDWFALELGQTKNGVAIYDLGVVDPNAP